MTQSQAPLKKEIASNDTREVNNRSCADTKSRVSSPVSGSPSPAILPSVPNSSSAAPFSAVGELSKTLFRFSIPFFFSDFFFLFCFGDNFSSEEEETKAGFGESGQR